MSNDELWQMIYDAAADDGSILNDDTVTAIANRVAAALAQPVAPREADPHQKCPTCGSPDRDLHPLTGKDDEQVRMCRDLWHRAAQPSALPPSEEAPKEKSTMTKAEEFLGRLKMGDSIVCSDGCSRLEISAAQACGRWLNIDGIGYIYRPSAGEAAPQTEERARNVFAWLVSRGIWFSDSRGPIGQEKYDSLRSDWLATLRSSRTPPAAEPERMFPLQNGPAIPWGIIAPFGKQCEKQRYQTLERLAERGGLSVCEALSVLEGGGDYDKYFDAHPELHQNITAQILRLQDLIRTRTPPAETPEPNLPCECGCGRLGPGGRLEGIHEEDYKNGEQGCS